MDAARRAPVGCVDVGEQAHAAYPSPDQKLALVANQNGKLLQRINTDYSTNTFRLDEAATLNLATCTTPSGAACQDANLRPDNAPICPIIDSTSKFGFITLRGGGMLVVDVTATPMAIVAEYDKATVNPNGCGGLEVNGRMYINSGGGTPANSLESDLYAFQVSSFSTRASAPNTPAPKTVFSYDDRGFVDSHGATLVRGRFAWFADRADNSVVIVDTRTETVINEIYLDGMLSADPAPDLLDVSPGSNFVFATLRGPRPLTGNDPAVNNAQGGTPGVAVIRVSPGGRTGSLMGIAKTSKVVDGLEMADPHAIRVRLK
jgi:hypothetical protein